MLAVALLSNRLTIADDDNRFLVKEVLDYVVKHLHISYGVRSIDSNVCIVIIYSHFGVHLQKVERNCDNQI